LDRLDFEKKDNFLKSRFWKPTHSYNISSDNPQKDNFHNLVFPLTKKIIFGTGNPTSPRTLSLPKGDGGWGKAFRFSSGAVSTSRN
jgi:hypothetical protein